MRYPFYFDDRLAGEFVDGFPRRPGCYVYTPNEKVKESMRQRLMERGAVECYYNDNDGRVFFTIVAYVLPGLVEIKRFLLPVGKAHSNT